MSDIPDDVLLEIFTRCDDLRVRGRISILSKKWKSLWQSSPNLEFNPFYNILRDHEDPYYSTIKKKFIFDEKHREWYFDFIDKTMKRFSHGTLYSLKLKVPEVSTKLAPKIDEWIKVALQKKVNLLEVVAINNTPPKYTICDDLFYSDSLRSLTCEKIKVPHCETIGATGLLKFRLHDAHVDEGMIQRIMEFCPLIDLDFDGVKKISFPAAAREPSLIALHVWNVTLDWDNLEALKNLRILEVFKSSCSGYFMEKLVSALLKLEILSIQDSDMGRKLRISSESLKELELKNCTNLNSITILCQNLVSLGMWCDNVPNLNLLSTSDVCHGFFGVRPVSVSSSWFIDLQNILKIFGQLVD